MPFVWHKRLANLQKHGLDFADVIFFDWESELVTPTHSNSFKAMGYSEDGTAVVIYGLLGSEAVSIISFRPASPKEGSYSDDCKISGKARFSARPWLFQGRLGFH
jgi:uncharacterized DUF497 family protein